MFIPKSRKPMKTVDDTSSFIHFWNEAPNVQEKTDPKHRCIWTGHCKCDHLDNFNFFISFVSWEMMSSVHVYNSQCSCCGVRSNFHEKWNVKKRYSKIKWDKRNKNYWHEKSFCFFRIPSLFYWWNDFVKNEPTVVWFRLQFFFCCSIVFNSLNQKQSIGEIMKFTFHSNFDNGLKINNNNAKYSQWAPFYKTS